VASTTSASAPPLPVPWRRTGGGVARRRRGARWGAGSTGAWRL